ncbi:M55 family metallopeptidase [Paralcaligenes sp. KSB-10]|uniref:M55 family metallopeptidase n=1 Tax=Paralcaligenes sp. KSB-10 TaxID=2901142 RepID=UPI001E477B0B|nr:M55 family metallopeptidase [Paralcaligenes sp. KSB-10]UHL63892.1 M55 family metallopeptidase [Paralcaligenes sp. KSB-10]
MRILVSTDIEGVAGVFHAEQTRPGNPEYERARLWMTQEANAAALGAFEGGASEVLVNDSHGNFRNLLPDHLDARVRCIQGKPRYLGMMAGLEQGCDAVFMIGYHSRAQGRGILAHTISSFAFARVVINDLELGEPGLYAALAGEYGVPVALGTGDNRFIEENTDLLATASWFQTKEAFGLNSGCSLTPAAAQAAIRLAAKQAMPRIASLKPFVIAPPINCVLTVTSSGMADLFCQLPSIERVSGVVVRFNTDKVESAVRTLNSLSAMSTMLR